MRKPGIREVARRAGVSATTISRVLNESPAVRPETARRVRETMQVLGFRVNAIGRSLVTGRSRVLGMLIPTLTNPVFSGSVTGFVHEAERAGFGVLLAASDYDPQREMGIVEMFLSQRVDGMALTLTAPSAPALKIVRRAGVPVVVLYNNVPSRFGVACICVDDLRLGRELVKLILRAGHRRVAMVTGKFAPSDRARRRYEGYVAAMRDMGLRPTPPIEVPYLDGDVGRALRPVMASDHAPTALFCSNDLLAISVIDALRSLGHEVPREVSVAGVDGIEVGRFLRPRLTTVVLPTVEMGRSAWQALVSQFEDQTPPRLRFLAHRIDPGGTVCRLRAAVVAARDPVRVAERH
jgi:DNA-binding LacI/PurR family transcriptional regulator